MGAILQKVGETVEGRPLNGWWLKLRHAVGHVGALLF